MSRTIENPTYFKKDITGQIFGRYQVLRLLGIKETKRGDKNQVWEVKCLDCNSVYKRNSANVVRSKYSCHKCQGKLISGDKHYKWNGYENITGYFVSKAKSGAEKRKRELEFSVDAEYLNSIWIQQEGKCIYTGIELIIGTKGDETTASLDRINSSLGYIRGNVQFVHKTINVMKWDLPEEDFLNFIKMIYEKRIK